MFSTLLESKRKKQRNVGATFMSAALHVMLVTVAVYATARANEPEQVPDETARYTEVRPPEEKPKPKEIEPPPSETKVIRLKGYQSLTAPIEIPTVLPNINLADAVTNPDDFDPKGGAKGGFANGTDTVRNDPEMVRFSYEVDKIARVGPGNPEPNYPHILRQANQTGRVTVQFVIDTTGKADMSTFKVLESTNSLFSDEVRKVLPKYNFIPAEMQGVKVRMVAQQLFEFQLTGRGGGQ